MTRTMNSVRSACLLTAISICGLFPTAVRAVPICQAGSLSSYIALDTGGGCTLGDFTFFRFASPAASVTGNPTVADASQIMLTPILGANSAGFSFTAMSGGTNLFSIVGSGALTAVTYHIDYSIDPAPVITGADLSVDPPFGNISATQRYCTSDVLLNQCQLGTFSLQTVTISSPSSTQTFRNPSSFVDIQTDIMLSATAGGTAGLDAVNAGVAEQPPSPDRIVGAVPEPANVMLALLGMALLAPLALFRRRRA